MIENNAETASSPATRPGKEIQMVRNPNWDPETDFRPAYLDKIDVQEGFTDTTSASRKILSGEAQVNGDFLAAAEGAQGGGRGGLAGPAAR